MKRALRALGLFGILSMVTALSDSPKAMAVILCENIHGTYCAPGSRGGVCFGSSNPDVNDAGFCVCVASKWQCSW